MLWTGSPQPRLFHFAMQLLLQEVAWDEGSRERKRQARLRAMSEHEGIGNLEHEPLFCAETALKVGRQRLCVCGAVRPKCVASPSKPPAQQMRDVKQTTERGYV